MTLYVLMMILAAVALSLTLTSVRPIKSKKLKIFIVVIYAAILIGITLIQGEPMTLWDEIKGGLTWITCYFIVDIIIYCILRARS